MEANLYKQFTVSRGFKYNYYACNLTAYHSILPTLVFIQGFGIGSKDWRHQAVFFKAQGYGLLVPDLLGYGDSSKPNKPEDLKHGLVARDIIEILDSEGVRKAIFIGQGGGSPLISRLSQLHPERIIGCAFIAIPYSPPNPDFDYWKSLEVQEKQCGAALNGYWEFFGSDPEVESILQRNFEGWFNITYPDDPATWKVHCAPRNAMRNYLLTEPPLPSPRWFSSPEDRDMQRDGVRALHLPGALSYYKAYLNGDQAEDAKCVPKSKYHFHHPAFFGAALEDTISLATIGKDITRAYCTNINTRVHDFKAGHWVHLQLPDDLNDALSDWFETLYS